MSDSKGFREELIDLLNKHGKDTATSTPDHILAQYIVRCLLNFKLTMEARDRWHSGEDCEFREVETDKESSNPDK